MNIELLVVLLLSPIGAAAADKITPDPVREIKAAVGERPEVSTSAPKGWHLEDLTVFTLYLPPDMKYVKRQGYDSFVGAFESKNLKMSFDYGAYTETAERYLKRGGKGTVRRYKIAGRPADIVTETELMLWAVFDPVNKHDLWLGITAEASSPDEIKTADIILRTVRIPKRNE